MEEEIICLDSSVLIDFYRKKDKTTAIAHGYKLATLNRKHFERIPGLSLVDADIQMND